MKQGLIQICGLLAVLLLPAVAQAQFTFTTNNGALTITKYTGSAAAVIIPSATNGLPISGIITFAFLHSDNLTNVTIPDSVTNIGNGAFAGLTNLTAISVNPSNPSFSSANGILFDKNQLTLLQFPGGLAGTLMISNGVTTIASYAFSGSSPMTVAIPDTVTNIQDYAFSGCNLTNVTIGSGVSGIGFGVFLSCTNLMNVTIGNHVSSIGTNAFFSCTSLSSITIPNSVTNIKDVAFSICTSLTNVYFKGNAPVLGSSVFLNDNNATVYYLPGTTGWGTILGYRPTVLWNPRAQNDGSFGVQNNQFGFNITGSSNLVIVVEACTNFSNPIWTPVGTNTLNTFVGTNGTSYFSDPQWTNNPAAFYRLRSP